ncbi:MAG: nicotinamide-nucleotide amidohydrolase family protein [Deltaproteobacteria bacterium]|nr:nicotinamide-nucleotide amidohydrolase family protein [Deltaproteobacteria bacterium]
MGIRLKTRPEKTIAGFFKEKPRSMPCIAIAESCTGGLVSHMITAVPGSSAYFAGGVVAYSNAAKVKLLGVRAKTLKRYGAVSRETALGMAIGAKKLFNAKAAVSITGIAGPGGATRGKPVGAVYICAIANGKKHIRKFMFKGSRASIKKQSAETALKMLADALHNMR